MAANPPLIQAGDVAVYAPKLNLNDPVDMAIVTQLCGEVSDMARNYCVTDWWIMPYKEQYYGKGNKVLMLKHRPIVTITYVTIRDGSGNQPLTPAPVDVNGDAIPAQVSSTQSYGSYWFDYRALYLGSGIPFPDGHLDIGPSPNVVVSYTAGYASLTGGPVVGGTGTPDYASIPADVKQALVKEVIFRKTESQRVGLKSVSDGNQQTSSYMTAPLDPQAKALLGPYRRVWGTGL
jgi:hypothetical protein